MAPTDPPRLTDRSALSRNRARAREHSLFLHDRALDEVQDRLSMVKRSFTAPLIVGPQADRWARGLGLDARCIPDDDTLDAEPGAHDLVIHAMALHWASDPVGQLIQSRRALRPDGLFLGCLFAGDTLTELRAALTAAESRTTGGLSPRIAPMAEIRDLGGLLQRAGLALPVADTDRVTVTYASPRALMHDLRGMGEGNALDQRLRRPTRRAVIEAAEQAYVAAHATPDGRVPATFEIIHLSGWAPAPDQPQPLRPGSATHRLASVLGTGETKLKH